VWSVPAALRAVRAVLVVAGLFALCHQVIEFLSSRSDVGVSCSVTTISFCDSTRHAPEHVFRHLCWLAGSVLYQIALFNDGTRILIELGRTNWGRGWNGH
jgi:hypothetical protein